MDRPLAGWCLDRVKGVHSLLREDRENVTWTSSGKMEKRKWKIGSRNLPRWLAFVAVRALPGIKPIRRDAEHVVALDADAVDDGADDGAGLERLARPGRRGGGSFFGRGF